jgi:phytoene/squalene synthetase
MSRSAAEENNDRLFCWEQVNSTNRLFRISRVFAARGCAEKLLPLYALFSVVEQACSTLSDEDVANSKLNWWRKECLHQDMTKSQHPLLKELCRTGADRELRRDSIAGLFAGATSRLSASAPADMAGLISICMELHRPQLELELDLAGLQNAERNFSQELLARNGMVQLLRETSRMKEQGGFWWVPLNLLARHGVGREELSQYPSSPAAIQLLADILGDRTFAGSEVLDSSCTQPADVTSARHVFAVSGLYSRKLRQIRNVSLDSLARELSTPGPVDLVAAWKSARKAG